MNGAERETGNAGFGANGEDLNVVLGRFQSWAATRTKTPPASSIPKAATNPGAHGVGKLAGDVREISYEQALRASRYRRPGNGVSAPPLPDSAAEPAAASGLSDPATTGNAPAYPVSGWNEAEDSDRKPWEQRWPEVRFAKASAAIVAAHDDGKTSSVPAKVAQARAAAPPSGSPLAESPKLGLPIAAAANLMPTEARRAPAVKRAAQTAAAAKTRAVGRASTRAKAETVQTAIASRPPRPQPAFRDVLKGTAALAASPAMSASPAETAKSTCLTMRVSDGEQARIQACAAQANLSVSAYLRQCALGVDELRGQVQAALLKLRKEQERELPPPGLEAIPGILRRFGVRCLRPFRGSSSDYTAVSIR